MRNGRSRLQTLLAGAVLAGSIHGAMEAIVVLTRGVLWVESPWTLVVVGVFAGALIWGVAGMVLGGLLGGCVGAGVLGGAMAIGLTEAVLAIFTDPAPYQQAAWWVNSPLAVLGVLSAATGAIFLARWRTFTGYIWAFPLVFGLPFANAKPLPVVVGSPVSSNGPNVLLVTLDTARGDHVGSVGYSRDTTPFFDALSDEGVRFEEAYAQIPVTGPSHLTILSGSGPWTHRTLLNGVAAPPDLPLLAERLSAVGYQSGAFVSAFVLDGSLGFSRGFRIYDDDFSGVHGAAGFLLARAAAAATRRFVDNHVVERPGNETVDLALSWLGAQDATSPWFLWVHLFDPHGPYDPPAPYDTRYHSGDPRDPTKTSMQAVKDVAPYLRDHLEGITDVDWVVGRYDGELAFADAQLGRLLEALDGRGEKENTLVVVVGDHGESLGEHEVWFNHGGDLYGAASRVPFAMRWPNGLPGGQVVDSPVELTGVAPTVYGLLGLSSPGESEDLSGLWQGREGREFARSMCFDRSANREARALEPGAPPKWRVAALRSADGLYVHREKGVGEMWSITRDDTGKLVETRVMDLDPSAKKKLQRIAADLLESGREGVERAARPLSDGARLRLEALGYVE